MDFHDQLPHGENRRLSSFVPEGPASVHIDPSKVLSGVSMDDPIGVHHRNDVKFELLPEFHCHFLIRGQKFDNSFSYVGGYGV